MTPPHTLPRLKARYRKEERKLLLDALRQSDWMLSATARHLDTTATTVQRMIKRHSIEELYAEQSPGSGRPKPAPHPEKNAKGVFSA